MNKFCSILWIIILGIFNIYSGCSSCKGGGNGGGKGVSSKNKKGKSTKGDIGSEGGNKNKKGKSTKGNGKEEKGKEGGEEEKKKEHGGGGEEKKKELINSIGNFINDSSAYNNKELNQFVVEINEDNKVKITFEGDHFTATSVDNWNEIKEDFKSVMFTISFKTNNNKDDLYWKFKDKNKISLENLRKSLAKIDDRYRENRKSHYLCVNGDNVLQGGYNCYIDLSDGIVYIDVNAKDDDAIRIHMCAPDIKDDQNSYSNFFSIGYYGGKYRYRSKNNKYVYSEDGTIFRRNRTNEKCIPKKQFMDDIGELAIIT